MQIDNILKVVDIQSNQLSPEFIKYFTEVKEPEYKDQRLKEDLHNLPEDEDYEEVPGSITGEIETLRKIMNKKEAGYFRIIFS